MVEWTMEWTMICLLHINNQLCCVAICLLTHSQPALPCIRGAFMRLPKVTCILNNLQWTRSIHTQQPYLQGSLLKSQKVERDKSSQNLQFILRLSSMVEHSVPSTILQSIPPFQSIFQFSDQRQSYTHLQCMRIWVPECWGPRVPGSSVLGPWVH